MRIARFSVAGGAPRVGRVDLLDEAGLGSLEAAGSRPAGRIVDVTALAPNGSVRELLALLPGLLPELEAATGEEFDLAGVELLAPVDAPEKFLGIGMNYQEHAEEAAAAGIPIPKSQMWFNKQVSCLVGPEASVVRPRVSEQLDYEVELGVVIGRECKDVSVEDARSVIGGYVVANDISVRDWLASLSPTFTLGKSFDTHGPLGPWITTDDAIEDPLDLRMTLTVNGEKRQDFKTDDMIYDIYEQIAYLTQVMTLKPGDVLVTGTPAGIGAPTKNWLVPGDVVVSSIEGLGALRNAVVDPA